MRTVAKDMLDPSKRTMLEIALGYERLAQMAEVREISKKDPALILLAGLGLTTRTATIRLSRAPQPTPQQRFNKAARHSRGLQYP